MIAHELAEKIRNTFEEVGIEIRSLKDHNIDLNEEIFGKIKDPFSMLVRFPNNYGASIVRTNYSYGKGKEVEIAVIKYDKKEIDIRKFEISYSTPITNDVIGYLPEEDIIDILKSISKL